MVGSVTTRNDGKPGERVGELPPGVGVDRRRDRTAAAARYPCERPGGASGRAVLGSGGGSVLGFVLGRFSDPDEPR